MTFDSAIKSLTDGRAAKYSTWGGYIFRTDDPNVEEFSELSTYSVGEMVKHENKMYICALDVTDPDEWNEANWLRADKYSLTFRRRLDKSNGQPDDRVYTYTPIIKNGAVEILVEPDGMDGSSPSSQKDESMLPFDASFLQALCTSDWTVGRMVDFEAIRKGTGKLW